MSTWALRTYVSVCARALALSYPRRDRCHVVHVTNCPRLLLTRSCTHQSLCMTGPCESGEETAEELAVPVCMHTCLFALIRMYLHLDNLAARTSAYNFTVSRETLRGCNRQARCGEIDQTKDPYPPRAALTIIYPISPCYKIGAVVVLAALEGLAHPFI